MKPISKRNYPVSKENITVSIRLPDTLKKELETLAEEYGRGFSDFIQEGLDQWAKLHRNKTPRR
jgi:predicted transcriptional regulator